MDIEMKFRNICSIITKIDLTSFSIKTNLSDLNMDSIVFIKLVIAIEEEFELSFDDDYLDMSFFKTLEDITKYIKSKKDNI